MSPEPQLFLSSFSFFLKCASCVLAPTGNREIGNERVMVFNACDSDKQEGLHTRKGDKRVGGVKRSHFIV